MRPDFPAKELTTLISKPRDSLGWSWQRKVARNLTFLQSNLSACASRFSLVSPNSARQSCFKPIRKYIGLASSPLNRIPKERAGNFSSGL
jgi:hypothetical protein